MLKQIVIILCISSISYAWDLSSYFPGQFYESCYSEQINQYIVPPAFSGRQQSNGILIDYRDGDTQLFGHNEGTDRTISSALYISATGTDEKGDIVNSAKDIHGVMAYAIAQTIGWDARGVMAFGGSSVQAGSGVGTNEFWAVQPVWSVAKAKQLAGVIAVVKPDYADCGDNQYFALLGINAGSKQAQTCLFGAGNFNDGIDLRSTDVARAGIRMSRSPQGSIIEYADNCYSFYVGGTFYFVVNGKQVARIKEYPTENNDVVTIGYLKAHGLIGE